MNSVLSVILFTVHCLELDYMSVYIVISDSTTADVQSASDKVSPICTAAAESDQDRKLMIIPSIVHVPFM